MTLRSPTFHAINVMARIARSVNSPAVVSLSESIRYQPWRLEGKVSTEMTSNYDWAEDASLDVIDGLRAEVVGKSVEINRLNQKIDELYDSSLDWEGLTLEVYGISQRAAKWRRAKFPGSTPTDVLAKLLEEAGELSRAVIGQLEDRPNRGDVVQEAAQTILVISSLIGELYPQANLMDAVIEELHRHEAML